MKQPEIVLNWPKRKVSQKGSKMAKNDLKRLEKTRINPFEEK